MDSISCETVLRDALDVLPNIKILSLTHKTGKMMLEYHSEKDLHELERILHQHNYTLLEEHSWVKQHIDTLKSIYQWMEQFALWIWIVVLIRAFTKLGFTQYLWSYWPNMWLWVAFLVWVVACGSSCLAVTWWIVVSYVEALEDKNRMHLLKVQGLFHIGRMIAFVWWWAILGAIWHTIQISPIVNAIFMMLVWGILAYVWLQIFWFVPSITKRWFHFPSGIQHLIKKFNEPSYALFDWALTFFLPCWFTQSMQLFAIQTWSSVQGALILWAYGLWTVPLLLWLWLSAWYFKVKMSIFNKWVALLLIVFGWIAFANGWNGTQNTLLAVAGQWVIQSDTTENEDKQETNRLVWTHVGNRLEPKDILTQVNKNYEITITPSMNGIWCKWRITLPDGTRHRVLQGQPITFNFNPVQEGTYKLLCNIWSPHGSIMVEG